jgi:hypothetical protein
MKKLSLLLVLGVVLGLGSLLLPAAVSAQCCDKTCVDLDGDEFKDDSLACNPLLLKGVGTLTGCLDVGLLCEGGQLLPNKSLLSPLYPLLSGCLCLAGGCTPREAEACAASAANACLAGGNAIKVKDDPDCGPVVETIMCEPVSVTQTHGEGPFFGNSRLGKVENGKVPCVHSETAEVAECVFNLSTVSWLESPSGTYVLMGQATSLDGGPFGEYVTAARTSAEDTVPCIEPTGADAAGVPSGTTLAGGCTRETYLSATNASGFPLENFTDLRVCSSDQVHPDAHGGGPENVGCFVNEENGGVSCCWSGEGAALNDPNGTERSVSGNYLPETHHCHMALNGGVEVFAAKRPAIRRGPSGPEVNPTTPIVWRPITPVTLVANGGTGVSQCEPVEVTAAHEFVFPIQDNARLVKIENGNVPCLNSETLEVGECRFDLAGASYIESPSGEYALIGQPHAVLGQPLTTRGTIAARVNAAGNVPCVGPVSQDRAGAAPTRTLSAFCVNETAGAATNATRRPLINWADFQVPTSDNPHPDAHEGGPTRVQCVEDDGYCTYTGEGAGLNDIYGTERDQNGVYHPGIEQCHMIVQSGLMVPAAKRPRVANFAVCPTPLFNGGRSMPQRTLPMEWSIKRGPSTGAWLNPRP